MAAVATRNPMQNTGTNGSRSNTPANIRGPASPSLLHLQQQNSGDSKRSQTPSRLTRASSDPPPDNLKRQPSNAHFELEPNPFEQSFSGTNNIPKNLSDTRSTAGQPQQDNHQPTPRRARSQSPVGTPSAGVTSSGPSQPPSSGSRQPVQPYQGYNRLPPLSALASPSTEALHASYWGSDNQHSLRSGPLSPAMLPGPTASTSAPSAPSSQAFDPNTFRTGLTPSISGSMANPPGPATAALFALMTNATPGGQPPNQFDLNFAQHMQQDGRRPSPPTATESSESGHSLQSKHQAAASTQSSMGSSEMSYGQSLPPHLAGIQPSQMGTSGPHLSGLPAHMQQQQHPGGHNPLYLFSQATASDFPGGNEEDLLAVNALRNLNSPQIPGVPGTLGHNSTFAQAVGGLTAAAPSSTALAAHGRPPATSMPQQPSTFQPGGSPLRSSTTSGANSASSVPTRGGKRKAAAAVSQGDTSETNARGTRKRAAAKRTKTEELSDEEEGQASMTANSTIDDMPTVKPLTKEEKKRMSEEDKRKNFLERNRQAALKCRQRKKAWLTELQEKVDLLQSDNETLQGTVQALKEEINMLRSVLISHKDCPVAINNGLNDNVMTTISKFLEGRQAQ